MRTADLSKIQKTYIELTKLKNQEQIREDLQEVCACRTLNPFLYDNKYRGWTTQEFKELLKLLEKE